MAEENMSSKTYQPNVIGGISSFLKLDDYYAIDYESGEAARLYILNNHVIRFYMSPTRTFLDYPVPIDPQDIAKITSKSMSDYGLQAFKDSIFDLNFSAYVVNTNKIQIIFNILTGKMSIIDKRAFKEVLCESRPLSYDDDKSTQTLVQREDEYFFGGGMQNGRFTHKGKSILIENTNNWVDKGVTSPCPFYWSTYGYGILRNTWQSGSYSFEGDSVQTIHKGEDFDAFLFINQLPTDILKDYYELTGWPILLPEYAFYEAHLNAFNRDYWVKVAPDTPQAILFEDGLYYKCYQPKDIGDKKGVLESLNGEKNNYQFSARAMVDRYKRHDMPLGWFVPNDGYGCGYGQTDSLDGDIENLKEFADYSRSLGVEVALWTESNLHPVDPDHPKKGDRDLGKEVGVAGVVALKCDVAWIGDGYSFGLNAVEDATNIFIKNTKNKSRPVIIMVDGWAGTQRYSGIWSGDQTGGEWEYIRFHIPTYIGTGLSGQPIVGSDMDGIYGGGVKKVNVRDYQWKTFTPLQLNMDGWGTNQKTPFAYDDECTKINRAYLKLKSMLMPYNYTIGYESIKGAPMVRAMFLEFPNEDLAYTIDSQYQFMWGPSILVAPVYNDDNINDICIRNGIFLPDEKQVWIDYFTGKRYKGGKILNNFKTPLWKIPVFIRSGAILPMVNANNNPKEIKREKRIFTLYPGGQCSFDVYEDDGLTSEYLDGHFAITHVNMTGPKNDILYININKTSGSYKGIVKQRDTLLQVIASRDTKHIDVTINGKSLEIRRANTKEEFEENINVCYFDKDFVINSYLLPFGDKALHQKALLIKMQSVDVTTEEIQIKVKEFINENEIFGDKITSESLDVPISFNAPADKITPASITLHWKPVKEASYYEIDRDGVIFTNIIGDSFTFVDLKYASKHVFKIRSVKDHDSSPWGEILEVSTHEDPYKDVVKNVKVSCNIPCQSGQKVCNLTDGDLTCMWHTDWGQEGIAKPETGRYLTVTFDLGQVYEINKVEYMPRQDAGNGTILELQYRLSNDAKKWSEYSNIILFPEDGTVKTIALSLAKFRYMEIKVLKSVNNFGSGREVRFFREIA